MNEEWQTYSEEELKVEEQKREILKELAKTVGRVLE